MTYSIVFHVVKSLIKDGNIERVKTLSLKIMELEEFKTNCLNKICLKRQRFDSKTCVRESKQLNCYKSYTRLEDKKSKQWDQNKNDWDAQAEFDNSIWIRDTGEPKGEKSERDNWYKFCRIWKILTPQEKSYVECDPEIWIAKKLEIAHIKPRSTNPDKIKDVENVVLISHLFHTRLTQLLHPIYKTPITNDEAESWLFYALKGKRIQ
jgi:hypothetical protein